MMVTLIAQLALMASLPFGSDKIELQTCVGRLDVFTYKASSYREGPLIVVCHGMLRNAEEYRDHSKAMAERFGAIVVAPCFSEAEFPIDRYQKGGLILKGKVQPLQSCSWNALPELVKEIRQREERSTMPHYFIGHSGGGQFLIRLAGFLHTDVKRIVVSNPGTYLTTSRDAHYPHGLGNLPAELNNDEALKRYLAQPVTLYLGAADVERDENLDKSAIADKLGKTRFERGQNAFRQAQQLARERNWPFHWQLITVPNVGHDHEQMFDHELCKLAFFGDSKQTVAGR